MSVVPKRRYAIGYRQGDLVVEDDSGEHPEGGIAYRCRCSCGVRVILRGWDLANNRKFCGFAANHLARSPGCRGPGRGYLPGAPVSPALQGRLQGLSLRALERLTGLSDGALCRARGGEPVSEATRLRIEAALAEGAAEEAP